MEKRNLKVNQPVVILDDEVRDYIAAQYRRHLGREWDPATTPAAVDDLCKKYPYNSPDAVTVRVAFFAIQQTFRVRVSMLAPFKPGRA